MRPYDRDFFTAQALEASAAAEEVVPMLLSLMRPQRVVDVGCGVGAWARAFEERGVCADGVDGSYRSREELRLHRGRFFAKDLAIELSLPETYDLALCLEVAEHLPGLRASSFIEDITKLAPVVVFSAAVPGQGGVNHHNEQWPGYWCSLFADLGFELCDTLRPMMWHNGRVPWYYRQNTMIFASAAGIAANPGISAEAAMRSFHGMAIVHPEMYNGLESSIDPKTMPLRVAMLRFFESVAACAVRAVSQGRRPQI